MNRCKRGHPWDEKNTRLIAAPNGRGPYRQCKACHLMREKLKYRNDPDYQAKAKQRAKDNYSRRKNGNETSPAQI